MDETQGLDCLALAKIKSASAAFVKGRDMLGLHLHKEQNLHTSEKNKHGHRTRYHVGQLDQLSSIRSGDAQEIDETYQVLESLEWSAAISWILIKKSRLGDRLGEVSDEARHGRLAVVRRGEDRRGDRLVAEITTRREA
ncbi:hypothetical protein RHGRI_032051 [Rhododendron griersonianum]|uniref:Uncharacterized protein n=1 Tax=Rhododendron griersonianum TaxID=479676 RepID=A0AAV6ICP6_9ERIC|nr:hypothetical protein RHGRI_032051 [Rhododendron griersonianum]